MIWCHLSICLMVSFVPVDFGAATSKTQGRARFARNRNEVELGAVTIP